jgi:hypothetical protein
MHSENQNRNIGTKELSKLHRKNNIIKIDIGRIRQRVSVTEINIYFRDVENV